MIQLAECIFEIPSFLDREECMALIQLSESLGFKAADVATATGRQHMSNIRNNERVNYHSSDLANAYWQKLCELQLPVCEGKLASGLSPFFKFYKYLPGQKFNMHKDGRQIVNDKETLYTFLIYLNQDCLGGATLFRRENLEVQPKQGSAIIFEHQLWHQGMVVQRGVKWVLRSDIVYG